MYRPERRLEDRVLRFGERLGLRSPTGSGGSAPTLGGRREADGVRVRVCRQPLLGRRWPARRSLGAGGQAQAVLVQGGHGRRHPAAVPAVGDQLHGPAVYTTPSDVSSDS